MFLIGQIIVMKFINHVHVTWLSCHVSLVPAEHRWPRSCGGPSTVEYPLSVGGVDIVDPPGGSRAFIFSLSGFENGVADLLESLS